MYLRDVDTHGLDAVGRLAGGVAHDFNNLLSVINGYCEILHDSFRLKGQALDELNAIHQAGQRATHLVRQLLAFSRRQSLEPRIIDPNRLVLENVDILSRMLGEGRSLELSLAPDTKTILVDPTQMQQALLNLCINARDATSENGRVTITTENRIIEPGLNRRITDLGPGRYVPNQGAAFTMFFPAQDKPASPGNGPLVPLPQTKGHESIILVEDDDLVRKMVTGILTTDGYKVLDFTRIATVAQKLGAAEKAANLVIIDPIGDDVELLSFVENLRKHNPSLRVLLTPSRKATTLPNLVPNRQALLVKPFALSALLQEVRRMLDQP